MQKEVIGFGILRVPRAGAPLSIGERRSGPVGDGIPISPANPRCGCLSPIGRLYLSRNESPRGTRSWRYRARELSTR